MTLNPHQHTPSGEAPAGLGFGGAAAYDKSAILRDYVHKYRCVSLVETGLFNGAGSGMPLKETGAVARYVALDYQVENVQAAQAKGFEAWCGDSARLLDLLLSDQTGYAPDTPCLFWLDAHAVYEHEITPNVCPVLGELDAIIKWEYADQSIVLIDDLWGFGMVKGWPTLQELREKASSGPWTIAYEQEAIMRLIP